MYIQEGTTEGGVGERGKQERKENKWGLEKSGKVLVLGPAQCLKMGRM